MIYKRSIEYMERFMNACARWVATRSCGCDRKNYLLLPYGLILMVRYLEEDKYSIDVYVNSHLLHGEIARATSICDAREKAICMVGSIMGKILHSLQGIDPIDYMEED
jgi:hypothetical protein